MAVAIAATGLVTYAYFSLASHSLPGADYGRLTLLWSAVFVTVSLIHRPVEQLLARSAAERAAHPSGDSTHLRTAAAIQVALAATFAVLALALRRPLQEELLGGSAALFWTMVAAVLAYAGSYFARGLLAGTGRLRLYGGLQLAESSMRTGFALAVAVGLLSGVSAVALGVAVAPAASLVALSALVGSRALRARSSEPPPTASGLLLRARPAESEASPAEPGLTLARGSGYAGGVLLIMASEQAFLNAGPVLVGLTAADGAVLAGLVFNALLIARAPLQLFQAVQASILPHLARLRATGDAGRFRRSVALTLWAVAAFAVAVVLVLLAAGPPIMELLFGAGHEYGRGGLALMGAGMGLYLGAATLTQAALARGQAGKAALRWVATAIAFVALVGLAEPADRILQVEVAFAAGALVLFGSLWRLHRRSA